MSSVLDRLVARVEGAVSDVLPDGAVAEERVLTDVTDGSPTYPLTEFNDLSRDLDLRVENKLIDSRSRTTPGPVPPGERSQSTTRVIVDA